MEPTSIGQVEMRNSERRRKALMSSCACIRLESAIRTVIADKGADEARLMRQGLRVASETVSRLILGVGTEVLKETCHIIWGGSQIGTTGCDHVENCIRQNRPSRILHRFAATFQEYGAISYLQSLLPCRACDSVNMQVYFRR